MPSNNPLTLLFESTRALIKAESLCRAGGYDYEIVPVPKSLAPECGSALRLAAADLEKLRAAFQQANLNWQNLYL